MPWNKHDFRLGDPKQMHYPLFSRRPSLTLGGGLRAFAIVAVGLVSATVGVADPPLGAFEPFSVADAALLRIDPRIIYKDEDSRQADLAFVRVRSTRLGELVGLVPEDPKATLDALEERAALTRPLDRLWLYGEVLYRQNTDVVSPRIEARRASDTVDTLWRPAEGALSRLTDAAWSRAVVAVPQLKSYDAVLRRWRRRQPHRLADKAEEILVELEQVASDNLEQRANDLESLTDFGTVKTDGRQYSAKRDYDQLLQTEDRAARREAWEFLRRGYASRADTLASALLAEGASARKIARWRNFDSAMEEQCFYSFLTAEQVERDIAAFLAHKDVVQRFMRANRKYVARKLGVETAEPWDLSARLPGTADVRMTLNDAVAVIQAATSVFGEEYNRTARGLFDLANRRMDLVAGPRKAAQAVTLSPYLGGPSVFFMPTYEGTQDQVVTLAHESAHAVHFDLMEAAQVTPYLRPSVGYIAEGVAKVNELLVLDELAKRAPDQATRVLFLRDLAGKLADVRYTTMFWAVAATKFEIKVASLVDSGAASNNGVHAAWEEVNTELDPQFSSYNDNKYMWAAVPNFTHHPRTYAKYLYAWLIAAALYERAESQPTAVRGLVALMRSGYSEEPLVMLKSHLGIDLSDPQVLESALRLVDKRVRAFEDAVGP